MPSLSPIILESSKANETAAVELGNNSREELVGQNIGVLVGGDDAFTSLELGICCRRKDSTLHHHCPGQQHSIGLHWSTQLLWSCALRAHSHILKKGMKSINRLVSDNDNGTQEQVVAGIWITKTRPSRKSKLKTLVMKCDTIRVQ